jgi:hypothetical protein
MAAPSFIWFGSLARPVNEPALDHQKEQIEAVAQCSRREDRGIHVRHCKQLLRFTHAVAEPVGGTDEHLGHHDGRERDAVAQADESLRQRLQQHHVGEHVKARRSHHSGGEQPGHDAAAARAVARWKRQNI